MGIIGSRNCNVIPDGTSNRCLKITKNVIWKAIFILLLLIPVAATIVLHTGIIDSDYFAFIPKESDDHTICINTCDTRCEMKLTVEQMRVFAYVVWGFLG